MNAEVTTREAEILDEVKARYIKAGFDFIANPKDVDLPDFLNGLKPDAIARRPNESVAIELKLPKNSQTRRNLIEFFSSEVPKHKGWKFELVLVDQSRLGLDSELEPDEKGLKTQLAKVISLYESNDLNLALIVGWALLEAFARRISLTSEGDEPKRYKPRSVIEALVSDGFITDSQGDSLSLLSVSRNRVVHGFSKTVVTPLELGPLIEILKQLDRENNT
jgi:REase_AHJR-like